MKIALALRKRLLARALPQPRQIQIPTRIADPLVLGVGTLF